MHTSIAAMIAGAAAVLAAPSAELKERQYFPPCYDKHDIGNYNGGDPHQFYKYEQLSSNTCSGGSGCEIAASDVEGSSITAGGSISLDGWISGGFEVTEYEETGAMGNCYGEPSDIICVYWRYAFTLYEVTDTILRCGSDDWEQDSDPYVIASPNSEGLGSSYVCAKNEDCKGEGFAFWSLLTAPGGPQYYPFSGPEEVEAFVLPEESQGEFPPWLDV